MGRGILRAKSRNKVYSMHRYPFMNNNGRQIYFILLPNLLMWIEIFNIQELVSHVTHCISGGDFKVPGQPGACPVRSNTGIWLRALRESLLFCAGKCKILSLIWRRNTNFVCENIWKSSILSLVQIVIAPLITGAIDQLQICTSNWPITNITQSYKTMQQLDIKQTRHPMNGSCTQRFG